ncbi:MAG: glycosyltransferase [Promethearchaeota archaeon]|nr:MAG: glycosyltransferase [Candidatus Lokiarchaeota archaeon]
MIKPKISVIIPTYNEENNIKETLLAVKKQLCDFPYEIIVTDGQSSDKTVSIAQNFAKVIISPQKGKAFQLNYATPKTSGDLLLFLDADTFIGPFFLQRIYRIFEKHKNLFACSARFKYYDGIALAFKLGSKRFTITNYFFLNINMHLYYFFKTLFGYPELSGSNIIVRRDIFFKAGGFKQTPSSLGIDKVFSDSLLYLIKKMKAGKVRTLNFVSVLTSGRHLNVRRSFKRISQYHSKKDIYYKLAKEIG